MSLKMDEYKVKKKAMAEKNKEMWSQERSFKGFFAKGLMIAIPLLILQVAFGLGLLYAAVKVIQYAIAP